MAEARETELFNRRLQEKQRRKSIAIEKAQERERDGRYVDLRDRELLDSA